MELSKKQMELDKFKITKEVENLELIGELSTKTEKQLIIKREIEIMLTKFKISESPIKKPALNPWAATSPNMWVMRTGPETACLKSTPLNKRPKLLNVNTKLL